MTYRVLDLFAGLGGWSTPFRERGWEVVRLDYGPDFDVEIRADILATTVADLGGPGAFDLVLASPPCEAFSVLRIGHNWTKGGTPKTRAAVTAYAIAAKTLDLIRELEPAFWVVENPRAKLRVLPVMAGLGRRTVTYCTLGEPFMKPTDLWGGYKRAVRTLAPERAADWLTEHAVASNKLLGRSEASTMGAYFARQVEALGTTKKSKLAALRAIIPRKLSELVMEATELDLAAGRRAALPGIERYEAQGSIFGEEATA